MSTDTYDQELAELLPFYLNGTLDEADSARVDAGLAVSARLRDEFEQERAMMGSFALYGAAAIGVPLAAAAGLQTVLGQIGVAGATASAAATASGESVVVAKAATLSPLVLGLGALVAAQGAYIGKSEFDKFQARPQMQAQDQAKATGPALVCTNYASDSLPFGFPGTGNIDLAARFTTIETITGTIMGTRAGVPSTLDISDSNKSLFWTGSSYFGASRAAANGYTGGWKTLFRYSDGETMAVPKDQQISSPQVKRTLDAFDIRFGRFDGIHPGKVTVPQGLHPLYVVQANERGNEIENRLEPTGFSLQICGKPLNAP
jgi:hypothetical protein